MELSAPTSPTGCQRWRSCLTISKFREHQQLDTCVRKSFMKNSHVGLDDWNTGAFRAQIVLPHAISIQEICFDTWKIVKILSKHAHRWFPECSTDAVSDWWTTVAYFLKIELFQVFRPNMYNCFRRILFAISSGAEECSRLSFCTRVIHKWNIFPRASDCKSILCFDSTVPRPFKLRLRVCISKSRPRTSMTRCV